MGRAIREGRDDAIAMLLNCGASLETLDPNGDPIAFTFLEREYDDGESFYDDTVKLFIGFGFDLDTTNSEKNNMALFGMKMSKINYNVLMWSIIAGLFALLIFFFYKFKTKIR